jgi:hypothetical protein
MDSKKEKKQVKGNGIMIFSIALYHLGGRVLDGFSYKQHLALDATAIGTYT